jgi:hypothetical protein
MFYRLINDKKNNLGEFPLPRGKMRLFIKESGGDGDDVKSQAFLGEDWAAYTPQFADLDLFVGVAQDVKVEYFQMPPEEGPRKATDEVMAKRITLDGKESVTKPQFQNQRSRFRYRLQNFKTEKGDPVAVPLTILEHLEGEWIVEKIELQEITGERNDQKEKTIPHEGLLTTKRIDVTNVEFEIKLPPTTVDKKYDLFITFLRKNRRY